MHCLSYRNFYHAQNKRFHPIILTIGNVALCSAFYWLSTKPSDNHINRRALCIFQKHFVLKQISKELCFLQYDKTKRIHFLYYNLSRKYSYSKSFREYFDISHWSESSDSILLYFLSDVEKYKMKKLNSQKYKIHMEISY